MHGSTNRGTWRSTRVEICMSPIPATPRFVRSRRQESSRHCHLRLVPLLPAAAILEVVVGQRFLHPAQEVVVAGEEAVVRQASSFSPRLLRSLVCAVGSWR